MAAEPIRRITPSANAPYVITWTRNASVRHSGSRGNDDDEGQAQPITATPRACSSLRDELHADHHQHARQHGAHDVFRETSAQAAAEIDPRQ